jgi:hypothetical protein
MRPVSLDRPYREKDGSASFDSLARLMPIHFIQKNFAHDFIPPDANITRVCPKDQQKSGLILIQKVIVYDQKSCYNLS